MVEQFIPQAFFRLLWLSDIYAERTGFLVEAADSYLVAARAGDLDGVRKASRFFFDSTAPALCALDDARLLDGLCFAAGDDIVTDVWSAGRRMVKDGRHIARERIVANYRKAVAALIARA